MSDGLRRLIREIIDEELDEVSTSAGAGAFNTPYAFRGNSAGGKKKQKDNSTKAGYSMVGKEEPADPSGGERGQQVVKFGESKLLPMVKKIMGEHADEVEQDFELAEALGDEIPGAYDEPDTNDTSAVKEDAGNQKPTARSYDDGDDSEYNRVSI